jgi:hypothetical protein
MAAIAMRVKIGVRHLASQIPFKSAAHHFDELG